MPVNLFLKQLLYSLKKGQDLMHTKISESYFEHNLLRINN